MEYRQCVQAIPTILTWIRLTADPTRQRPPIDPERLTQGVVVQSKIGLQPADRRAQADIDRHHRPFTCNH